MAGAIIATVILWLAIRSLIRMWHAAAAQTVAWHFAAGWILAAAGVAIATYLVLIETWRRTVRGYGVPAPWTTSIRVWILSNFGKYFGSFGIVAGMAVLAQGAGLRPAVAVTAAVIVQALALATGVVLSGTLAWGALVRLGPLYSGGAVAIGLAAIAGTAILHSQVALDRLRPLLPEKGGRMRAASLRALAFGLVGNAVAWVGYGAVMTLLARGLFASAPPSLGQATSAYTVSYLVGLLALFVPAGLGLREFIFTALLAPAVGLEVAGALAIASRLLLTLVEFAIALPFVIHRPSVPRPPSP